MIPHGDKSANCCGSSFSVVSFLTFYFNPFLKDVNMRAGIFQSRCHRMHRGDPMSYRITYGSPVPDRYITKSNPLRLQSMTAVCLLLFSLSVRLFFPSGAETLRSFLLPGKFSVTQTAVESFMGDIRSGEPLGQSFTAFCTYIIDHDETFFS